MLHQSPNACVLISVYVNDNAKFFQQALNSIDFNVISKVFIGVDGPIGASLAAVINNLDQSSHVVYWFNANRGLAATMNELIFAAMSDDLDFEYFFRMDADDICTDDRFIKQKVFLDRYPDIDCLGGSAFLIDENNNQIGKLDKPNQHQVLVDRMCIDSPFIHPSVVIRRKVLQQIAYPTDTILFEDVKFWYLIVRAGYKVANLPDPILHYRMTNDTLKRRVALKKVINETKVRLIIFNEFNKTSIFKFLMIFAIFFAKILLPFKLQTVLWSRRARISGK